MPCSLQKWPVDGATDLFGQIVSSNNRILCYNIDLLCQVEPYNIQLLCSWYILDSWVVSHLALNICILCLVWLWVQALVMTNSFSDTSKTSMFSSWFYLVYLIWYYYLSVKFVMWIVKQKIENKRNLFVKNCTLGKYLSCLLWGQVQILITFFCGHWQISLWPYDRKFGSNGYPVVNLFKALWS